MKVIVTVVGKDRVGIIAGVCTALATYNVNVLDISQTVMQGYFTMMMAAYGISRMREIRWIKSWYPYWCILMFVAAVAWNWFKLKGRGMI